MDQFLQPNNNQKDNKNPINIPPLSSDSFAQPVPQVSPVLDNNISKPATNAGAQNTSHQFKLASAEVQGPKPPLVSGGSLKFALAAIILILIVTAGIGGYYYFNKSGTDTPRVVDYPSISPIAIISPVAGNNLDTDNDGLPNAIEKVIGTSVSVLDTDGDTFSDLSEIKNGYSPIIAGVAGKYTPEEWSNVKGIIKIEDREFYEKEFGAPVAPSSSSIITIDKSLDTDKDGLPDEIEKIFNTDMSNADTDGDKVGDFQEIKNGYSPTIAGAAGKYSLEEWSSVKGSIKIKDREFYEKEFGASVVPSSVPSSVSNLGSADPDAPFLSEDRKSIVEEGDVLLAIDDDSIFNFFKTESGLCDNKEEAPWGGCLSKETFKTATRFASIVLSPDKTNIGFDIENDKLVPDKAAGIFYPHRASDKVYFLTSYYLGNEFIGFSPAGINFAYRGNCWEGLCGLYIKNSETLENVMDFNNPVEGLDARVVNSQFIKWISDNEIEYKLGAELKRASF